MTFRSLSFLCASLLTSPLARAVEALPDLVPVADQSRSYVYGWYLDRNQIAGRTLLRLSTCVANAGQGPLEIWGGATTTNSQQVYQRVYNTNGTVRDVLSGNFIYHPSHSHIHLEGFATYNLRRIATGGGVGEIIAAGQKTSFCLLNVTQYYPSITTVALIRNGRGGNSCGTIQGISTGYADVYGAGLADQWIDVTMVPSGTYWLEVIADPDNHIIETSETNNTVRIQVTYTNPNPPPVNRAPVITNPGNQSTEQGTAVALQMQGSDPDGQAISWSASGLPAGLTIASGTGLISGTVSTSAQSTYNTVISATDGSLAGSVNFTWTTTAPPPPPPVNRAPQVFSPGNQTGTVPNTAYLNINATDPDGNTISYSATGLPPGLGINSLTGLISGNYTTAGTFTPTVSVSDGLLSSSVAFTWVVNPSTTGTGLRATYFSTRNFSPAVLTRTDAQLDFNWGTGSPAAGVPADEFSARWSAELLPQFSEEYTFTITADNGCKLWVDSNLLIYQWENNGVPSAGTFTGRIPLQAGVRVPILVEFFEAAGNANIRMTWRSASQAEQVIPAARLFPIAPPPVTDTTYPTATLTGPASAGAAFSVNLVFSEPVYGLDAADFAVSNGSVSSLLTSGDGLNYTVAIQPNGAGDITVRLPASAVSDAGGNGNIQSNMLAVAWVQAGPAAYDRWRLDETSGTAAANSVRPALGGTHQNGVLANQSGAAAATGRSCFYDGTDDITALPALNYTSGSISLTAWVKRSGAQKPWAQFIYCRGGRTDAGFGVGDNHELRYHWEGTQWQFNPGAQLTVPDDTWVLAALIVQPDGATLCLRTPSGLVKATNPVPHGVQPFDSTAWIGGDGTRTWRAFKGQIDDVQTFQSALTDSQIEQIWQAASGAAVNLEPAITAPSPQTSARGTYVHWQMQGRDPEGVSLTWTATGLPAGLTINASGLISGVITSTAAATNSVSVTASDGQLTNRASFGWAITDASGIATPSPDDFWPLSELSGTTAANVVQPEHSGTHLNGVRINEAGAGSSTGRSAYYDGVDDVTAIPALNYSTPAMTAVMWVKRNGRQNEWSPFFHSRSTLTDVGLGVGGNHELRYHWEGTYWQFAPSPALTLPDNEWALAALAVQADRATLYLRTAAGMNSAINIAPHDTQPFEGTTYLAWNEAHDSRHFKGWLDEVRFYRRTLSTTEIEAIYLNGAGSPRPIGVTGTYFNGRNFESQILQRVDSSINFNWGTAAPASGVNADNFSVRWTGCLVPQFSQTYTFHVLADQGCRLWIGNQLIIDNWAAPSGLEVTGTASLTASTPQTFRLEFYETTSTARCEFYWSSPSQPKQIIPQSRLLINETSMPEGMPYIVSEQEDSASDTIPASLRRAIADLPRAQQSITVEPSSDGMLTLRFSRLANIGEVYDLEVSEDCRHWSTVDSQHWSIRARTDGYEDVIVAHACCLISPRLEKSYFRLRARP